MVEELKGEAMDGFFHLPSAIQSEDVILRKRSMRSWDKKFQDHLLDAPNLVRPI